MLRTIWGDDQRYESQYWSRLPGVYFTGGAQELIVSTLQPDGQETPMLRAIRESGGTALAVVVP